MQDSKNKVFGILEINYYKEKFIVLDLSKNNKDLHLMNLKNSMNLEVYIENQMVLNNCRLAIGKYAEDRIIYSSKSLFAQDESRSFHLGLDFWTAPGTKVYTPLNAKVHSFKNNDENGNYGPTIILEHEQENITLYTLYGHLSESSISNLEVGKEFKAGEHIGSLGTNSENGNWPPHLHFQVINNMLDNFGDFPGVCSPSQKFKYMNICPDPNLLLKIPQL